MERRYSRVNEDYSLVEMAVDVHCYWEAESWKKGGREAIVSVSIQGRRSQVGNVLRNSNEL